MIGHSSTANTVKVRVIMTININLFEAATQEQRKNRIPSHLHGVIALHRVSTDKNLGAASIWARGSRLDLKTNYMPDTVREFADAIAQIY